MGALMIHIFHLTEEGCLCRYDRTPVDEAVSKGDTSLIECITRAAPIPEEPVNGEANGLTNHDTTMEDA